MSHALKRAKRLPIPPRDRSITASPRAAVGDGYAHNDQVKNAFDLGFARYEKAMEDLSKV